LLLLPVSQVSAQSPREEFNMHLKGVGVVNFGSRDSDFLIKKIIESYQALDPKPAIPKQAETHLIRGETVIEMAKDDEDFKKAVIEFKKALRLAPWYASAYFNLAVAYEASNDFIGAGMNFERYLLASPDATDKKEVERKLIQLVMKEELLREGQYRQHKIQKKEEDKLNESKFILSKLAGQWIEACGHGPDRFIKMEVDGKKIRMYFWSPASDSGGNYLGHYEWGVPTKSNFNLETRTFLVGEQIMYVPRKDYMYREWPSGGKCEYKLR